MPGDEEPEVNLNLASLGEDSGPNEDNKFSTRKKELKRLLRLKDEKDWVKWLQSNFVKPWWVELWTDYLTKRTSTERACGIKDVQAKLAFGESHGRGTYSTHFPEKGEWEPSDHLARFICNVKTSNSKLANGVFYGRKFTDGEMDRIIWGLKGHLVQIHSPSYINTITGGTAIFGTKHPDPSYSKKRKDASHASDRVPKTPRTDNQGSAASSGLTDQNRTEEQHLENEDDSLSLEITENWEENALKPREIIVYTRESEVFNAQEPYWKFRLIVEALRRIKLLPTEANSDAIDLSGEPTDEDQTAWDPPLAALNSSQDNGVFDPQNYIDLSDMEALISATIDTSAYNSGLIIPSKESLQKFRELQQVFDNRRYQRDNHQEACEMLGIADPNTPRMRSMNRPTLLKGWQPVAIAALIEIRAKWYLSGAVLGDTVGLGKTWQTVGFMLYIWEKYNEQVIQAQQDEVQLPEAKPFLIVVPPGLIMQWVSEISRITNKLRVLAYYGDGSPELKMPTLVRRLKRDDVIFDGSPINARTVIISSYQTINHRHGPAAVKSWCANESRPYTENTLTPPSDFPSNLRGCFSDIIIDEAHTLRNENSSQSKAIRWLGGKFHLLLTGTFFYNSKEDLRGYVPLLFNTPSVWQSANWEELGISPSDNVFDLPQEHPAKYLCCSKEATEKYVLDQEISPMTAGKRLGDVLKQFMIRRTLLSRVPFDAPKSIGADIPPVQRKVINVQFSDIEQKMYDDQAFFHRRGLFTRSKSDPSRFVWNMRKFRKLVLLSSWLGFYYVDQHLHAKSIPLLSSKLSTGKVAKIFAEGIKFNAKDVESLEYFFENCDQVTNKRPSWTLEFMLRGGAKMRAMLPILRDQVIVYKEKAIIWSLFPAEQVYIGATLLDAGMDAQIFHAGLSISERETLVEKFTRDPDSCMVLVCSYAVNSAGLNLHHLCRNVHLFSPGTSKASEDQAIGRICRMGQSRVVLVYEYRTEKTFNTTMVGRNRLKAIPGLVSEMSREEDGGAIEEDVDIGRWVIRGNELYRLEDDEEPTAADTTDESAVVGAFLENLG